MRLDRKSDAVLQGIIVESLSQGRALSRQLLEEVDVASGTAVTYVPPDARALSWSNGGVITNEAAHREHVERILSEIDGIPFSIAIGENVVVRSYDGSLRSEIPFSTSAVGDDLYEWTATPSEVGELLTGLQNPWLVNCFLASNIEALPPDLDPTTLDVVARHIEAIIVGAFDAEGFVVWKRAG